MAFDVANLHLQPGAVGDLAYIYDAGSDTMATVIAAGYFNNTDDMTNLQAEDVIWCQCGDGNMTLRVSAVSSGSVTTQFAGGNLPIQTFATGTVAETTATPAVGFYEVGTSIATATRFVCPTPYPGAELIVHKVGSGTQAMDFDAGGSGATAIVFNAMGTTGRRITLRMPGESFHVVGSSTSRWRVYSLLLTATGKDGSYAGEGASVSYTLGT